MSFLTKYCFLFLIPFSFLFSIESHAQSADLKDSLFYEIVNQLMVFDTLPNKHKASIDTVGGKMIVRGTYAAYLYKKSFPKPTIEDYNIRDTVAFRMIWVKAVKKYYKKSDQTFVFQQLEDTSTFIIDEKRITDIRVDLSEKPLKIRNNIRISRPVFNSNYTKAIFSVDVQKNNDYECRTYLIEKANENWKLKKLVYRRIKI